MLQLNHVYKVRQDESYLDRHLQMTAEAAPTVGIIQDIIVTRLR